MYRSKMNFLTHWFLKIKWLFEKCLKITKETAIHKNGFSQSFRKNLVYSLVNFIGWTWPFRWTFFPLNLFALGLFCLKCPEEDSRFNHFKSYENHVNKFLYCQYSKMSYSYVSVQSISLVPAYFWQLKRLKIILWKETKLWLLSIFRCQDVSKNGLHSEMMLPSQLTASLKVAWKTIASLKFLQRIIIITSHIQVYFTC